MHAETALPFTERRHPNTHKLDGSLSPHAFLATLRSVDLEMHTGDGEFPGLLDSRVVDAIVAAYRDAIEIVKAGGKVVMTGCGTSGRIAFLTARRYQAQGHACFDYVMAGGDAALALSDELPEDDPRLGAACVEGCGKGPKYVVGVSCGLSAAWVAGQIADAIAHGRPAAVIGFNPAHLARNAIITSLWPDGRSGTFRDLVCQLNNTNVTLVNPVIGPEPVAGSSRMKGGTATLILLDVLCHTVVAKPFDPRRFIEEQLMKFTQTHFQAYQHLQTTLPRVMQSAADSLRSGGHLYYLGSGSAGCVGFIDLSEMPDTYGAPFDQARGFVLDGFTTIRNREGDITSQSPLLRLSTASFGSDIVPHLTAKDTVVVLGDADPLDALSVACSEQKASVHTLASSKAAYTLSVSTAAAAEAHMDLEVKLALNAVSTYAQAAGRGALFKGTMIAAGPANDKIYARCLRMICETTHASQERAEIAMIRAIYHCDASDARTRLGEPRANHIKAALLPPERRHEAQLTLPLAFLLALDSPTDPWPVQRAVEAFQREPQLSRALEAALRGVTEASNAANACIATVDFGGTNIRAALVKLSDGKILDLVKQPVPSSRTREDVMSAISSMLQNLLSKWKATVPVHTISISQPGNVRADGSVAKLAAFPNWGDDSLPLRQVLGHSLNCAVHVFEDAECAVAAEVAYGAGRLAETVVAISVGTGVGSAVALNNGAQFLRGARGLIELGHHIVDLSPTSRLCSCGQRGCLEAYASGTAIAHAAGEATAEAVLTRSDSVANDAVSAAVSSLAVGCINATRAYDPDVIVICGALGTRLAPEVRGAVKQRTWTLHDDAALVPISVAACEEPGLQGAAALALRKIRSGDVGRQPRLRHATSDDASALYRVCLKTGDSGNDGTALFSDPELLGQIYVGPYVFHSSRFAFALEDANGDVSGYVLGVLDTLSFEAETQRLWWPHVKQRYPLDPEFLQKFRANEIDLIRSEIHKSSNDAGQPVVAEGGFDRAALLREYPSHMHIDLIQHVQGHGYGGVMVTRLLDALRGAGSVGVYLIQSSENRRAFHFYTKLGFALYHKFEREWVLVKKLN